MTGLILLAITAVIGLILPVTFGAAMINLAGFFIGTAGMLLDLTLKYLIVDFDSRIYMPVADILGNTVWATFRDISNILIIGMFTFIAISIIIGAESFNTRKMVARILIIAVLINFSLFFTRFIIAGSNFLATQFYKAMSIESLTGTGAQNETTSNGALDTIGNFASSAGISGQFINLLGLPSAFDTRGTLDTIYDSNGGSTLLGGSGGITAIIYGFTTATLMLATTLVLGYATFLIIVRTVLLLFLLITSALAFAAYLIPQWGDHYWSMWWNSLLKSALFAPLLMMMLWATLLLSNALVKGTGGGSFDKLFSDPTSGSGILAILIFLVILGMLFTSIRFATAFSSKISGFDAAKMASLGVPLGLSASLAGWGARNLIGRGYAKRSDSLDGQMSDMRQLLARVPKGAAFDRRRAFLQDRLTSLEESKKFADKMASSKFALGNTAIGKKALKATGAPEALGGSKDTTSFAEFKKKTAEEAAKRAAEVTKLSSKDTDAVRDSATKVLRDQKQIMEANLDVAKRSAANEERARAAELQQHENDIRNAESNIATWQRTRPAGSGRDADLNREKMRIENARQEISKLREQFNKNAGVDVIEKRLQDIKKSIENTGKDAVKAAKDNVKEVGATMAQNFAYERKTNVVPWAVGGDPKKDQIAQKARGVYNKKVGESETDDRIKSVLRSYGASGSPPGSPPAHP